jgi:hypothetical protein
MEKNWVIYLLFLLTIIVSSCENFTQNENINDEKSLDDTFEEELFDEEFDDESSLEMTKEDCFEDETYDPIDKLCYIDCETEEECSEFEENFDDEEFYDDEYFFEMTEEDCFEDETYDPIDKLCYIDCETEEECSEFEENIIEQTEDIGDPFFEGEEEFDELDEEESIILATYNIIDEEIILKEKHDLSDLDDTKLKPLQDDTEKHKVIWNKFKEIVPLNNIPFLTEFEISTDGKEGTFASVGSTVDNFDELSLDMDIEDAFLDNGDFNEKELIFTIIHEYGHIITTNNKQIKLSEELSNEDVDDYDELYAKLEKECQPNYFLGGCTKESSYINLFFKNFWKDIYSEFVSINDLGDSEEFYEKSDEFYLKYEERFISDYASTNIEEDIAESFTFFILEEKPQSNSIAKQKVLFFYDFSELVNLRKVIRSRLGNAVVT